MLRRADMINSRNLQRRCVRLGRRITVLIVTPPKIKPLTEEEKKQRLEELREKMAEKRAKKAVEEAKEHKANETLRRKAGKVRTLSTCYPAAPIEHSFLVGYE
jgi:ribosomal protein L29